MKKKLLMVGTILAMMAMVTACSSNKNAKSEAASAEVKTQEEAKEEVKEEAKEEAQPELELGTKGKLVATTNAEFPPYEYHEGDQIIGIDIDIANEIAKALNLELEVIDTSFDSIILEVSSGKSDIGIAGMTVTEDRLQNVDFTDTYNTSTQKVLVKNDSPIKSVSDLEGKSIGVQLGTTSDIMAEDIKDANVAKYNKSVEAIQAMTLGQIDAVILDLEPSKEFVKTVEGIKMLEEDFVKEDYAIAVKKGNTNLKEAINKVLAELKENGKIDEIKAKYIKAE